MLEMATERHIDELKALSRFVYLCVCVYTHDLLQEKKKNTQMSDESLCVARYLAFSFY